MYVCTCRRVRRNVGSRSSDGPATLGFRRLGSGLCDLLYHMYTYLPIHLYIHTYIHTHTRIPIQSTHIYLAGCCYAGHGGWGGGRAMTGSPIPGNGNARSLIKPTLPTSRVPFRPPSPLFTPPSIPPSPNPSTSKATLRRGGARSA